MGCWSDLAVPNSLNLPIKLNAGALLHTLAHGFTQHLDIGGARAAQVDEKIAMQFRDLRAAYLEAAAAGRID
jgi:hypothetical protein